MYAFAYVENGCPSPVMFSRGSGIHPLFSPGELCCSPWEKSNVRECISFDKKRDVACFAKLKCVWWVNSSQKCTSRPCKIKNFTILGYTHKLSQPVATPIWFSWPVAMPFDFHECPPTSKIWKTSLPLILIHKNYKYHKSGLKQAS